MLQDSRIETVACDVSNWQETRTVVSGLGEIDMIVNNAGVMGWQNILDITEEEFDRYSF